MTDPHPDLLTTLVPTPIERPWGGTGVPSLGLAAPRDVRIGEYWLPASEFPLLVKILDARENLSIQLHPDDATAQRLGLSSGKTEAWLVLAADPGAALWLGLAPGVGAAQFLASVERGEDVSRLLVRREPAAGDFYFVPAGTVHALGAGLVVLEIQQPADVTFRVYDWNRRPARPLHLAHAAAAIREDTPVVIKAAATAAAAPGSGSGLVSLHHCEYFAVSSLRVRAGASFEVPLGSACELYFCRSGAGSVEGGGMRLDVAPGMFLLARPPLRSLHLHAARSADAAAPLELVRMTQR